MISNGDTGVAIHNLSEIIQESIHKEREDEWWEGETS